jgi:hypothetical protein
MRKILVRILLGLLFAVLLLAGWIAYDLYAPLKINIREFDAGEVARLDTAMWRSYYDKQPGKLYGELIELLQKQYQLPFWRRQLTAFYATKAAIVFKDGHERADYEKALPDVENFYAQIHDVSSEDFDYRKAAKLELEWWIVHRERKKYQEGDRALAETAAAIYNQPKTLWNTAACAPRP